MRISVIGTGYVGLVSGVCLAEKGHDVTCVDVDASKVQSINAGVPPIHEEGLEPLLKNNLNRRFRATTDLPKAVLESDLSLIAVGTPFKGDEIDLRFIREAARQIGVVLADKATYHVVVVKSTVVPGTTDSVVLPILESASGKQAGDAFGVGMNPEFLREGSAVADFLNPDRIVLGALDERTGLVLQDLYAPFPGVDVVCTSPRTAEMIKYAANSLLATMISFSNEIGNLCAAVGGVDVVEVMKGVHLDKRLSPIMPDGQRITPAFVTYLEAGCGFGGSCFPKDLKALIAYGRSAKNPMRLLESVVEVNQAQPAHMLALLGRRFPSLDGVRVAVLGLAFKPGTDDIRESPALPVIGELLRAGAKVTVYDPIVRADGGVFPPGSVAYAADLPTAVKEAEAILVMTRWSEFQGLHQLLADRPSPPLVVDGRRMLDRSKYPRYEGIGLRETERAADPARPGNEARRAGRTPRAAAAIGATGD
jgi:UDPglucose 6-dehydrogenase